MKLRCTHNSIRLRVRKSELDTLQQMGAIAESILFLNKKVLSFALKTDVTIEEVVAQLIDNEIIVSLPREQAEQWIATNQVGIEANISTVGNEQLHILVEKDFPCLDRENEDKSDTFWELAQEKDKDALNC